MENFLGIFDKYPFIGEEAKEAFARKMEQVEVSKGHLLVKNGEVSDFLFFMVKGSARTYYVRENREITVSFSLDREFLTAMHSFITRQPSFENIETLEKSTLYRISYSELQNSFSHYPEVERAYRMILEQYYIVLEEQHIFAKFKTARERYLELMETRPKVIQKASVGQIASYLDMTIETLSRIRSKI